MYFLVSDYARIYCANRMYSRFIYARPYNSDPSAKPKEAVKKPTKPEGEKGPATETEKLSVKVTEPASTPGHQLCAISSEPSMGLLANVLGYSDK